MNIRAYFALQLARLRARFRASTSLTNSSAEALATVAQAQADIKEAEARLALIRTEAVTTASQALKDLQAEATAAALAEAEAEKEREKTLTGFDSSTAAQVRALEQKLAALKSRRAQDRRCIEDEINVERGEAATEAETARQTEAEIAAAIEALQLGADAQTGLNTANEE